LRKISITPEDRDRFSELEASYRHFYDKPGKAQPRFIVHAPCDLPPMAERLKDPAVMLEAELATLDNHLQMGDDHLPIVRVQFGTPQVASAFGCEVVYPENSLPAAGNHPLKRIEDVNRLLKPGLASGLYTKVEEFTTYFLENLPEGVHIQHPDIQSPFNTAHLIRGDDIFTDFYDNPEGVGVLLDKVTLHMIDLVPHLKSRISLKNGWFYDWGGLWKGSLRISNCSMQMISPDFYMEHVLPRDIRLMAALGGGRMHYCGRTGEVIKAFFRNPQIHALDFDSRFHDLWEISRLAPAQVALFTNVEKGTDTWKRILSGDFPDKKNWLYTFRAESIGEGRDLLERLRVLTS
jgi:hypothetical protein